MQRKTRSAIDWLLKGNDDKVHLIQFPNLPLIGWLLFFILSRFSIDHTFKIGFANLSVGFLAIWSYLEITQGSSRIRQMLGIAVGAILIYSCF